MASRQLSSLPSSPRVKGIWESHHYGRWQDAPLANIRPARQQPQLRALSVDIETSFPRTGQPDRLFSIGCYAPDLSVVLMIGEGENNELLEYLPDEPALLTRFIELIQDYDRVKGI